MLRESPPVVSLAPVRLRDRPWLLLATIAVPLVELAVLWTVGLSADRALCVQITAPSPLGEYHDLRWLMVLQSSWLDAAAEAVAALALRSLLNAFIVHQAWPGGDRPAFMRLWRRTAIASLALELFIAPWAALAFGVDVVSISWLSIAAIPPILIVAVASPHSPVSAGWWHQVPPLRSVGWAVLILIETTVAGAVVRDLPAAGWIPALAVAGLVNAWAWRGIVATVTGRTHARTHFLPASPAAAIGMVVVAIAGTALAFSVATVATPPNLPMTGAVAPGTGIGAGRDAASDTNAPIVVVGGFDTSWNGDPTPPVPGPFAEQRFSYRGLSPSGQPLPYPAAATHQSVAVLARLLAAQVARVHQVSGRPVNIVAESEGALVARIYAAASPSAPVSHLILLSPLDQPGGVYYPTSGHQGYGILTGWELQGLTSVLGGISPVHLPADNAFLRSIVDHAGDLRNLLSCPVTKTPEELIEPLADSIVDPANPAPNIPTVVLPAFHGGLLSDPAAQADIRSLLVGDARPSSGTAMTRLSSTLRLASASWQVPPLPLSLFPSAGSDHPSCPTMTNNIKRWVGP